MQKQNTGLGNVSSHWWLKQQQRLLTYYYTAAVDYPGTSIKTKFPLNKEERTYKVKLHATS